VSDLTVYAPGMTVEVIDRRPSSFTDPFDAASPWKRTVASYPAAAWTPLSGVFSGFFPSLSPWPYTLGLWSAVYQSSLSDPQVNLYYHAQAYNKVANGTWARSGNNSTIEATIRLGVTQLWAGYQRNMYSTAPSVSFHQRTDAYWSLTPYLPAGAIPAPDADGHMSVFQPNGWALETDATIVLSNGDIVCLFASYTDSAALGTGQSNGRRASMIPNYAGLIRNGEMTTRHIQHALAVALSGSALAPSAIWPAIAYDSGHSDYGTALPMGSLLSIPASVNLATLGLLTPAGATLALAAQEYGCYVVDRDGPNGFVFATELNVPDVPTLSTRLSADLTTILGQLHRTAGQG
jgi:hypothetical protein